MVSFFRVLSAGEKPPRSRRGCYVCHAAAVRAGGRDHFFWMYFRQSSITATRMMMPENTNWRLASMPRTVRE